MPYLSKEDLKTRIYPELIDEITRSDDSIATQAISAAIQETKMYLARYDLLQLFGNDTTASTVDDPFLKGLVKDLAAGS